MPVDAVERRRLRRFEQLRKQQRRLERKRRVGIGQLRKRQLWKQRRARRR
jgi:hypothetical protein